MFREEYASYPKKSHDSNELKKKRKNCHSDIRSKRKVNIFFFFFFFYI